VLRPTPAEVIYGRASVKFVHFRTVEFPSRRRIRRRKKWGGVVTPFSRVFSLIRATALIHSLLFILRII
jgi:hypothetical protein